MAKKTSRLYGGVDPRTLPSHSLTEVAAYLRVPRSTLRAWFLGMGELKSILAIAQRTPPARSFFNIVEAHVLNSICAYHGVPETRRSLRYVERQMGVDRPLVRKMFQTDGVDFFVEHLGHLLNVSRDGQLAMREGLAVHFLRLDFDQEGVAERLYPFTRARPRGGLELENPKSVVFDPRLAFGRLVVAGTGVPTAAVADRFVAGDTLEDLAADYGIRRDLVEEAIRCENLRRAA